MAGGTATWERAQVAWEIGQSLPEFEARPDDQQDWLLATWRAKRKIETIGTAQSMKYEAIIRRD